MKTHIGGRLKDVKYIFGRICLYREDGEDIEENEYRKQRKKRENRAKQKNSR